jgi:hypothetical protein
MALFGVSEFPSGRSWPALARSPGQPVIGYRLAIHRPRLALRWDNKAKSGYRLSRHPARRA